MKKLFVSAAILLGAVTILQAGVRFELGVGIPLPGVVVSRPAAVYSAPPVYYAAPPAYYSVRSVYCSAPAVYCPPRVYCPAPVVTVAPPTVYVGCGPFWNGWHHWGVGWGWRHRR